MEQGKQELLNAILEEATAKAAAIKEEANSTAKAKEQRAAAEVQSYLDDCASRDATDSADLISRRKVAAGMEGKKALLAEKRALLAEVKSRLVERLYAMGHDDYLRIVDVLLNAYATEGDSVFIAKNNTITFGEVQSLNVCSRLSLKVSYDPEMRSGVVLRGKAVDKDLSFEALADSVFAEHEMELATRLFGK